MIPWIRKDVENQILKGRIEKQLTHDSRGIRYRIFSLAAAGRGRAKPGR
jgi:hypothetical protein